MAEFAVSEGVRFGRTVLLAVEGDLVEQAVEALVLPANIRGIMGAGMAGAIRIAGGPEIEREAMAQAPLALGDAIWTAPGDLASRGVQGVVHAVVSSTLGAPTTIPVVQRAVRATLRVAGEHRHRTIALPPVGSGTGPGQLAPALVAEAIVLEVVAHLRRSAPRLDRIVFVSRASDDVRAFGDAISFAHDHAWGPPE